MRKIFLLCVTCFSLFLIVPTIVHGENPNASISEDVGKSRITLFGNVKKVDNVLKDKTESIDTVLQETVNGMQKTEINSVTSGIKNTGDLLSKTVTDTVEKTTSEVTNVVNDTVNSVVYGLPTVPVVPPVVKDINETVKKTTSSVQTIVETTGEFVNETLKSTIDASEDEVIEPVETVDTVPKVIELPVEIFEEDKKISSGNVNIFTKLKECSRDVRPVPKRDPITPLAPEIKTDVLSKQVGTSELEKHSDIGLDNESESSMNDEVNLKVDSILVETSVNRQSIDKKLKVLEQANGLIEPIINSKTVELEKKDVDNPNHSTKSSQEEGSLPPPIIMGAPSPTASLTLEMGGQTDLSFLGIVDVFMLKSSGGGKWIHLNEVAITKWAHAPPGKPPQQSPFLNV
ncbi:hypothetical protein MKZ26_18135 [Sporosarcina sp. FSL K6-6792]|uniref:hypothetical protein n=1 Tax=Sporosarcina sp. FSL K6-6792 TaxID=2921559 RepID=UPI0030F62C19